MFILHCQMPVELHVSMTVAKVVVTADSYSKIMSATFRTTKSSYRWQTG